MKFNPMEDSTTTVEILGGESGPVQLDSDNNWVGRIENINQKIRVVSTKDDQVIRKVYSLRLLKLEK